MFFTYCQLIFTFISILAYGKKILTFGKARFTMRNMTYDEIIKHYGSEAEAARARDIDRQRVHGWKKRDRIPTDDQIEYEILTSGKLLADIPKALRKQALSIKRAA